MSPCWKSIFSPPASPIRTWSLEPAGSRGLAIFCSGRSPMPNSILPLCSGRILTVRNWQKPSPNTNAGEDGSAGLKVLPVKELKVRRTYDETDYYRHNRSCAPYIIGHQGRPFLCHRCGHNYSRRGLGVFTAGRRLWQGGRFSSFALVEPALFLRPHLVPLYFLVSGGRVNRYCLAPLPVLLFPPGFAEI